MKTHPVRTLLIKLAILALPFGLLLLWIVLHVPYGTYLLQESRENKVQRLLVDSPQVPQVVIAGDSRAAANFIPAVFSAESNVSSVNAGSGFESLQQAYDVLRGAGALNHGNVIAISVSVAEINDAYVPGFIDSFDIQALNAEPFGVRKLQDALQDAGVVSNYYLDYMSESLRLFKHPGYQTPQSVIDAKGYEPETGVLTPPPSGTSIATDPDQWYGNLQFGGFRQKAFVQAVQDFGHTNNTIVIYIGPTPPLRKSVVTPGTKIANADAYFAHVITDAIAPYPNMHFINFSNEDTSALLPDASFANSYVHLNEVGAAAFSKLLADTLLQEHIISK
jgi:hypothetical protein